MSLSNPSLVGREREIGRLMKYLGSSINGEGTTVFISGEAGVGKTSLVKYFLRLAEEKEVRILQSWCLSGATVPYFPFIEAFNAYMEKTDDKASQSTMTKQLGITGWLKGPKKEVKTQETASAPIVGSDRTFDAVLKVILELCENEPHLLFIDDLQWADHLSLSLLNYLTKKCRDSKLLILGAYRSEEIVPVKDEAIHPLEETMFSLSREGLLNTLELERLLPNDIPQLIRSLYDTSFSKEFIERLYRETEGNPLFAIETLNLLEEEGFLIEKDDRWVLTASPERMGIPSKVQDVITRRLLRVGRDERRLLDLAAVIGKSFYPELLCSTLTLDIIDVFEKLIEIEKKHKIIRSEGSSFEFSHQKIREVIYDNLQQGLRRLYHLQLAKSLERVLDNQVSNGQIADIAYHYVGGGAPDKAFKYLLQLGEKAVRMNAYFDAVKYLTQALEATEKNPALATNEDLMKIHRIRGSAWHQQELDVRASENALNDYQLSLDYAEMTKDENNVAESHLRLAAAFNPYFSDSQEMEIRNQQLMKALHIAQKTKNKFLEGRVHREISISHFTHYQNDLGFKYLNDSLKCFKEINSKSWIANVYSDYSLQYYYLGEYIKAKEYVNKALTIFREIGESHQGESHQASMYTLSIIHASLGEYNEALFTAKHSLKVCQETSLVLRSTWTLNAIGWIYYHLSNIELSLKYNNESLKLAREHHKKIAVGGVPYALTNLGMIYLSINDYDNAEKYYVETENTKHLHRRARQLDSRVQLGLGEIALHKGDISKALENAEKSLEIAEEIQRKKYVAKSLMFKAEVLAKMNQLDEASEFMENALKLAQEMKFPFLMWQMHYKLGLILEENGQPEKAHKHYASALTLIEETAEKLDDENLRNSLLNTSIRKSILESKLKS